MFHEIVIVGRLGRDQESRYTPNGKFVSGFSAAVDDGFGEHKKTIWFKCSFFGERAEKVAPYLVKGQVVLVRGRLQATDAGECRTWNDQGGKPHASFEIMVDEIKLLPSGRREDQAEQQAGADVPF